MQDIEGKQAVIISRIACDAHAISASAINMPSAIDTHVDKAVVSSDIAIVDSSSVIDVVHIARSRVGRL